MYALQTNASALRKSPEQERKEWLKAILASLFIVAFFLLIAIEPAFAGPASTGGTGTSGTVNARVSNVAIGFQGALLAIGASVLSAGFLYVGYGMAFGGKQWKDVANVAYGALIAGMGSMLVGWLFS